MTATGLVLGFYASNVHICAQSADELEKQYYRTVKEAGLSSEIQDSLQNRIDRQIETLRIEKEKNNPDREQIKRMMAEILELRGRLKERQQTGELTRKRLQKLRDQLQIAYTRTLDSLTLIKSRTDDKTELKNLEESIAFILEKQLILTPVIQPLTYRLSEMDQFVLSESADSLEQRFLADYIRGAMLEIDDRIDAMKKAREKYDDLVAFQRKLETFTDDLETPFFSVHNRSSLRYNNTGTPAGYNEIGSDVWNTNVQSLKGILSQLSGEIQIIKKTTTVQSKPGTNYEDYIELIKLTEKSLIRYRKIVQKKSDALQKPYK